MINNKVLITYASRAGSTAEIAEAIGKTLSQRGTQVEVLPMQDVKDLSVYGAVAAGSAMRSSKWLPEAMQFITTHRAVLSQKPFPHLPCVSPWRCQILNSIVRLWQRGYNPCEHK